MKVRQKKEQYPGQPLDDIEIVGLAGTSAAGTSALLDYGDYVKSRRKALKDAQKSEIISPVVDITKKSNKKRIKLISKNDWKTLSKHAKDLEESQTAKEQLHEGLKNSKLYKLLTKDAKRKFEGSVLAGRSKVHQVDAARYLKSSRGAGKIAAGVGIGTIGYSVLKNSRKQKNK